MKERKPLLSIMRFFIYTPQTAHGIIVIVENLVAAFQRKGVECRHIKSLNGVNKDEVIIPYGVKEANEVIQCGFTPFVAFMADAITLGYKNKIRFYLKHFHLLHYDFFYSLYGYLKYKGQEKNVARNFENAIFVSKCDINYMEENYANSPCRYLCVANGAPNESLFLNHSYTSHLRIGLLSSWVTKQTFEESNWFVREYWKKYTKRHPDDVLYIAGRGSLCKRFKGLQGVEVLGEINDLGDFFANIDVSLVLCPKGCGILNRVLDSFMYKVPVVGYESSFSGFPNSDDISYKFTSYWSFERIMESIINNRGQLLKTAEMAYAYAKKFHNWEKNYDELVSQLLALYDKR